MSMQHAKNKGKKKKSVLLLTIIATTFLVAGIALLLFPYVSNFIGTQKAEAITEAFDEKISNVMPNITFEEAVEEKIVDDEGYPIDENGTRTSETRIVFQADLDRLYADSIAYNKSLINNQGTVDTSDYTTSALDMSSYGIYDNIYCYITAPSINMRLPVYLGANDYNMSYGAAHLCNTSLPIGNGDANVAIAAHTGYIGRIFFDNIRQLDVGDEVTIKNYFETINYTVTTKKIVDEKDSSDLFIKSDAKLLTLITCISDGNGGFDRYIVICETT